MEARQAGAHLNVKICEKVTLLLLNFAKTGPAKAQATFGKLPKSGIFSTRTVCPISRCKFSHWEPWWGQYLWPMKAIP